MDAQLVNAGISKEIKLILNGIKRSTARYFEWVNS
jgi:hypothetical protein